MKNWLKITLAVAAYAAVVVSGIFVLGSNSPWLYLWDVVGGGIIGWNLGKHL